MNFSKQKGVALVSSLLMLTLIGALSIGSMGSSIMQEKMAYNQHLHDVRFQASNAGMNALLRVSNEIEDGITTGTSTSPLWAAVQQGKNVEVSYCLKGDGEVELSSDAYCTEPGNAYFNYSATGDAEAKSSRAQSIVKITYEGCGPICAHSGQNVMCQLFAVSSVGTVNGKDRTTSVRAERQVSSCPP